MHLLRTGHHPPTKSTLQRLTEAEIRAGLRKSPAESKRLLVDFLRFRPPEEQVQVSPQDVDEGSRLVEVKYRRGVRPEGYEDKVLVHAPKDVTHAARLWVQLLLDGDLENIVLECLDPQYATKEFLKLLDPRSFMDLAEAAIALTLGVDWRKRFPGLAKGVREQMQSQASKEAPESGLSEEGPAA
jgi:hypothetical protein